VTQPKIVWRVRHVLIQEPGYIKGVCWYCGINVFVTDERMKVGDDNYHYACAYDRRKALVLAQNAAKIE